MTFLPLGIRDPKYNAKQFRQMLLSGQYRAIDGYVKEFCGPDLLHEEEGGWGVISIGWRRYFKKDISKMKM